MSADNCLQRQEMKQIKETSWSTSQFSDQTCHQSFDEYTIRLPTGRWTAKKSAVINSLISSPELSDYIYKSTSYQLLVSIVPMGCLERFVIVGTLQTNLTSHPGRLFMYLCTTNSLALKVRLLYNVSQIWGQKISAFCALWQAVMLKDELARPDVQQAATAILRKI